MIIKEVVLTIKNSPGELARVFSHLYENDVSVAAFWVAPQGDMAHLRLVATDPESAISVLTGLNLDASFSDALGAEIPNHPGGVNAILKVLQSGNIDIRHMYSSLNTRDPVLVLDVDKLQEAMDTLKRNWITLKDGL